MATLVSARIYLATPDGGSAVFEMNKFRLSVINNMVQVERRVLDEEDGVAWVTHCIYPLSAIERIHYHYKE